MLKQRVLTGVILVAVVLSVIVYFPALWFSLFVALVICLGAWEWSRLCGWQGVPARCLLVLIVATAMFLLYFQDAGQRKLVLLAGAIWWVFAYWLIRRFPDHGEHWKNPWLLSVVGMLVLLPSWSALLELRSSDHYLSLILLLIAMVVAADTGAYFSGKAFGRHKLAAKVSPNKTWEGFIGGMLLSCITVLLVSIMAGKITSILVLLQILIAGLAVAVVSVVGDLFESMIKRQAGVKDSGVLLPGHGGILDRIDSITAALPLFTLALSMVAL